MRVETLRSKLAQRFPETLPRPELPDHVLPFGIAQVDGLLPWGGLSRGRLAEIVGEHGSGRTSLVKGLVRTTCDPVAIVDAEGTLCPSDWSGHPADLWIAHPSDSDGLYAADVLLRSRAFGLVVIFAGASRHPLAGGNGTRSPRAPRAPQIVRLQRLAEEARSVCLFVAETSQRASVVTTRLAVSGGEFFTAGLPPTLAGRRITVWLEKGGPHRAVEVVLHEEETDRLLSHPEAPDRAPVAWRGEGGRPSSPRFA